MRGRKKNAEPRKLERISFRKLSFEAIPEMWTFQLVSALIILAPVVLLQGLINLIAGLGGNVVTTANMKSFILSWRFPVIIAFGILLVLVYIVFELLAMVHLTDNILSGKQAGTWRCIKAGFKTLRRFMNPAGISVIVFIVLATPFCGVGMSISLSKSFRVPHFIMEVILKNKWLTAGYIILLIFLIWFAFKSAFVLHAVILDGMTPKEGKKYSTRIVKEHTFEFLKSLLITGTVIILIIVGSSFLFSMIPNLLLGGVGEQLPKQTRIDVVRMIKAGETFTDTQKNIIGYRIAATFAVLVEKYLVSVVTLLCGAYFMLRLNRWYLAFTGREQERWLERPKRARYIWKVVLIILVFIGFAIASVIIGAMFNQIIARQEPAKIIAHRAGGGLASENSLEGIEKAVEHGCYGSEIDIQRTKDGYYIINHDNDFKRLTGVAKGSMDMTLDEIKELRIKDTTGSGRELSVPTLEEMLDAAKGRIKLFVELKGPTADKQMVDDAVRIIKEHDCIADTALISLNYSIIDYAETTYPEFETGTLFFGSLGDITNMNCDLLIMEEETATNDRIDSINLAQKQSVVWTVNTEDAMYRFLDTNIDAVITDEIEMAGEVQAKLDGRTDLEVLEDKFDGIL